MGIKLKLEKLLTTRKMENYTFKFLPRFLQ